MKRLPLQDFCATSSWMRCQATNAIELLNQTWETLTAGNGALLNRLLDRFLFVASIPDPGLAAISDDQEQATRLQHLLRIPFWPYWGPLLTVLHARRGNVVRLAALSAARSGALARTAPDGRAASAHAVADACRGTCHRDRARDSGAQRGGPLLNRRQRSEVYEAAIYAAPGPDAAAALCLELAGRKDISPDIADRITEAHRKRRGTRRRIGRERTQQGAAADRYPARTSAPRMAGRTTPKVDREFQEACLVERAHRAHQGKR